MLRFDEKPQMLASIKKLKSRLSEITEPDFGLLDELVSVEVLTLRQYVEVRSERTPYGRNDAVLDLLASEEQCVKFLTALQRTGQQHVVNLIKQNGDIGTDCGDTRPLDEARMRKLTVNGVQLLDCLDANSAFITDLANAGCITWSQREHLVNIVQPRDRNDKLREFLTRRSVADFDNFIKVLSKEQSHLVPLLVTDGVVVGVDAELDESSVDDVNQTEDRIVSQWADREVSADEKHQLQDRFNEILRPLGYETTLVVIRRASSLALYFICMSLSAVVSLRDQWRCRQLRDTVQALFTYLLTSTRPVFIKRLAWSLTDYQQSLEFFNSVQEEGDSSKDEELSADMPKWLGRELQISKKLNDLPLEMLETVLMRSFFMLYSCDFEADDDRCPYMSGKSRSSAQRAFRLLASVCSYWHLTLTGWPQSPTPHWLRHKLKMLIERSCRPFDQLSRLMYTYTLDAEHCARGVAWLHDVVYIVCHRSSALLRFSASTHQRLTDLDIKDLRSPWDIVACERTSQLYVADDDRCIWRVSSDGKNIKHWLPKSLSDTFKPQSLSVTSTRLLVTSPHARQLIQFDADGDELRRVQLPDDMIPFHAMESPTGTFISSQITTQLDQYQVTEVNTGGEVLRQFSGSQLPSLGLTQHVAVDSHGNVFVADRNSRRILLLDAQLRLRRVVVDDLQLNYKWPWRLCYMEQSGQLLVALYNGGVVVFDVLHH